jgi:hypothetical protein
LARKGRCEGEDEESGEQGSVFHKAMQNGDGKLGLGQAPISPGISTKANLT